MTADGSLQLDPLFIKPGLPDKASQSGEYTISLLDASGRQLLMQSLELTRIAVERVDSGEMTAGFHLSLPFVEGVAGIQISRDRQLVFERYAIGAAQQLGDLERTRSAEDGVQLDWSAENSKTIVPKSLVFVLFYREIKKPRFSEVYLHTVKLESLNCVYASYRLRYLVAHLIRLPGQVDIAR